MRASNLPGRKWMADGKAQIRMGDTAQVSFDPRAAHYFDPSGERVALYDAAARQALA